MLVLKRLENERIVIGHGPDRIEILVVDIRGDSVRIGVTAPPEVPVHRREVYDAIIKEHGENMADSKMRHRPLARVVHHCTESCRLLLQFEDNAQIEHALRKRRIAIAGDPNCQEGVIDA